MKKLVYGVGINDGSRPTRCDGKDLRQYHMWRGMLRRCYSEKERHKFKSYSNCSVSENFKNYSYFYDWYNKNCLIDGFQYHLDKDLLSRGNKIYSEDTCSLLPIQINSLLVLDAARRGDYLIGVCFDRKYKKFRAAMGYNGRIKFIGNFDNEMDAHLAYKAEKERYVKSVASIWKHAISSSAYAALMKYTVSIND